MKSFLASSITVVSCLLLSACSSLSINTDYDRQTDFSGYKTFATVAPKQAPANPLVLQRFQRALETELTGKGLTEAPADTADLLVVMNGAVQQQTEIDSDYIGPRWGSEVDVYQYNEGTVIIDLVDRKQNSAVWRGTASDVVDGDAISDEEVTSVVQKLFAGFPPPTSP